MIQIARRLQTIQPSASMVASMAARQLAATGVDVIDLGLGEPDFPTPAPIVEAAFQAARTQRMLYTPALGTAALRQAIVGKLARENNLAYVPDEIAVANGAKQVIFNALMATLNEGEEVILPAPYFVSYPELVKLFGGTPVVVPCGVDQGFRLTPAQLESAMTPRTRWLFLNSPCNPSGAVYDQADLAALGEVLDRHPNVWVLSDEIYEHILFDGRAFVSFGQACPQLRERTLIVNGVSKAYAMTGWRVGYGAGPRDLIRAMGTVQSQSCTSVSQVAQIAAQAALESPPDETRRFCQAFERRRDLVVQGINRIPGLSLASPQGAFYAYIDCTRLIGARTAAGALLHNDVDVAQYLLQVAHVSGVPGTAYGLSPFVRLSTATSDDVLQTAVRRIAEAVTALTLPTGNPHDPPTV